jgi:FAD/FMN-containing dehydrogenase
VAGPGVGGFSIGGGYSWKTNEYGLTIDTIKSYTLVLPNGTITKVDDSTPDLFFALRGGFNRFGVLVDAEFATHDQVPKVYAGTRLYSGENVDRIVNATSEFIATNKDPKANVITTMLGSTAAAVFFYDGPEKPESFKGFDGIDTLLINSVKTQSFSDFVNDVPSEARKLVNNRAIWETFSTTGTTLKFLQALKTEAVVRHPISRT